MAQFSGESTYINRTGTLGMCIEFRRRIGNDSLRAYFRIKRRLKAPMSNSSFYGFSGDPIFYSNIFFPSTSLSEQLWNTFFKRFFPAANEKHALFHFHMKCSSTTSLCSFLFGGFVVCVCIALYFVFLKEGKWVIPLSHQNPKRRHEIAWIDVILPCLSDSSLTLFL